MVVLVPVKTNLNGLFLIPPGSENALKTMLEHNLDVHAKDKTGGTALHSAAYSGHVSCVKLLIQFGACVDALDMLQHTPIYRACEMGHTEVVNNLILSKYASRPDPRYQILSLSFDR